MATRTPGSVFARGLVLQTRYRLDEPLAIGGMAEVWRGHDLILERQVAIKLLHPHLATDPALVERFRREAISAARLAHPHIVPTYDAGTDGDVTYIVLGLIHGQTLAEAIDNTRLEPWQAVSVARQVADALHHAHAAGIVHRDVKPSNILVVDSNYRVMVADFGIAKAVAETADESLTLPGLVIGTPAYLAPEQASGAEADARSDVYAVGILLHEMLCGHTSANSPTQVSEASTTIDITACDQLPDALRPIVEKATAADPADRYQSAEELRDALSRVEASPAPGRSKTSPARMPIGPVRTPRPHAEAATGESLADTGEQPPVVVRRDQTSVIPARPAKETAPAHVRATKRRRVTTAVAILLVLAAAGIGRFVGSAGDGGGEAPVVAAPALVAARSFDPLGDRTENQAAAAAVVDNDAASAWSTETYANRNFGNLKAGVGLVLEANTVSTLSKLEVTSTSSNWAATIYVSDSPGETLDAWGPPVDVQSGLGTTATFDLHRARGGALLIWITNLGDANRVTLTSARLSV